MNETLHDPQLRTFRMPIAIRLRQRIDAQSEIIAEQERVIAAQDRRIKRLEREQRKTLRELRNASVDVLRFRAQLRALTAKGEGGGNTAVAST